MSPRPPGRASPDTPRERELRQELQRAYESLTDITSRLLLANEAAEAALSTHDRVELSERLLEVAARACEVRRAALFLIEGDGLSVGAALGLSDAEQEELPESDADVAACQAAVERRRLLVLDAALVGEGAIEGATGIEVEEVEEAEAEEETEGEAGEDDEAAEGGVGEEESEDESETQGRVKADARARAEAVAAAAEFPGALFGLFLPVHLEDEPIAVLALGARARGRPYVEEDMVFLRHALRQFAAAIQRGTLLEKNEERLRELDALLRVSREITSTLDLDSVLRAVVNTVAAVVENDRAEIALVQSGKLVLRAVSGRTRLDPDQAEVFHLERPLEYLLLDPKRLHVSAADLEENQERPGAQVFLEYFGRQEMRSFMALPLRDEQGLLGFLCLESQKDAWDIEPAEGDALEVVASQTTVAIRNAQLYREIPLRGVARPVMHLRHWWQATSRRQRTLAGGAAALVALLSLLPVLPDRAGGTASVVPYRHLGVRAMTEGVIGRVFVRGGEEVREGQPIAELVDLDLGGRVADLRGQIEIVRREIAGARQTGDAVAWRSGQIRLGAMERTLAFEERRVKGALLRAPLAGQVLDLNLKERAGQYLGAGESFCTVAALDTMAVEIEVSEDRIGRVRLGAPVALKVQAFPGRTFRGRVAEVGWRGRESDSGVARFLVRAAVASPDGALRPGMGGVAKAAVGWRAPAAVVFEPIARALQLWLF